MFCRSSYTKRCFRGILWPVLFIITCVKQDWRWLMTIGYPSCGPCPAGQGTDADPGTQRGGQGGTGGEAAPCFCPRGARGRPAQAASRVCVRGRRASPSPSPSGSHPPRQSAHHHLSSDKDDRAPNLGGDEGNGETSRGTGGRNREAAAGPGSEPGRGAIAARKVLGSRDQTKEGVAAARREAAPTRQLAPLGRHKVYFWEGEK